MPVFRKLLLTLGALVLGLAAAEAVLRVTGLGDAGPQVYRAGGVLRMEMTLPDSDLLTRLKPHIDFLGYYRTNDRGWRGSGEVEPSAPAGALRIVCLGDSSTFGIGVTESNTWPRQLEAMLNVLFDGAATFDVVNAGVPGYSTWQNRVLVDRDVPDLHADVVVLMAVGHNDATGTPDRSDREAAEHNRSLAGRLQGLRLGRLLAPPPATDNLGFIPPGTPGARRRVSPEEFTANLEHMAVTLGRRGTPLVLVAPPQPPRGRAPDVYGKAAVVAAEVAAAHGLPLADPRLSVEAQGGAALFVDGLHPGATGHACIAYAVLEALVQSVTLDGKVSADRLRFARAWVSTRREGLPPTGDSAADRPPALAALITAYDHGAAPLPPEARRCDPLVGSEREVLGATALRLAADRLGPGTEATALRRRANQRDRRISPPDLLGRYLFGPDADAARAAPLVVDDARLSLARAFVVYDRMVGAPHEPRDRRLNRAEQEILRGDADAALVTLQRILDLNPDDLSALERRGRLLLSLGRSDQARADFDRILELAPESAMGHLLVGRSAWEHGDGMRAEAELREALERHPALAQARYLLGRVLMDRGAWEDAALQLRTARQFERAHFPDIPALLADIEARRQEAGEPAPPPR